MDDQKPKEISKSLILEFAVGGGRPPAASEMLQIHQDGRAIYLSANAWPRDEAGLYQVMLSTPELKALEDYLSEHKFFEMSEQYGPVRSDSGFQVVTLCTPPQEKTIKWGAFAQIPVPLAQLQQRLVDVIQTSLEHPVQIIKATVRAVPEQPSATCLLECSLQSSGVQPVFVFLSAAPDVPAPDFRVYVDTNDETDDASLMTRYYEAQPLRFVDPAESPIELSPGEEVKVRVSGPFVLGKDKYRLYGFLEFTIGVMLNDELTRIGCFVVTKSATE